MRIANGRPRAIQFFPRVFIKGVIQDGLKSFRPFGGSTLTLTFYTRSCGRPQATSDTRRSAAESVDREGLHRCAQTLRKTREFCAQLATQLANAQDAAGVRNHTRGDVLVSHVLGPRVQRRNVSAA